MYLGVVYDAMRTLGYRDEDFFINIKPHAGYSTLITGPALTTFGRKTSPSEDYPALDNIRLDIYKKELFSQKPIVLLQTNDKKVAHSGDITSLIYKELGAQGFITDGCVRDIEKINELNFPCFCTDVNPIDALDYWALTDFNIPIEIKGVMIKPGDIIFASRDGVINVPQTQFEKFNKIAQGVLDKENNVRALIQDLAKSNDFTKKLEEFVKSSGRW